MGPGGLPTPIRAHVYPTSVRMCRYLLPSNHAPYQLGTNLLAKNETLPSRLSDVPRHFGRLKSHLGRNGCQHVCCGARDHPDLLRVSRVSRDGPAIAAENVVSNVAYSGYWRVDLRTEQLLAGGQWRQMDRHLCYLYAG